MSLSEEIILDMKNRGIKITEDIWKLSLEELIELNEYLNEADYEVPI